MRGNMMLSDLDLPWNMHQLCMPSSGDSPGSVTLYEDFGHVGYVREGYQELVCSNLENDAVIASTYGEELSRLAAAEASGFTNPGEASILSQDWHGPLGGEQNSGGYEYDHREAEDPHHDERERNDHNQGTHEFSTVIHEQADEESSKGEKSFLEEDLLHSIDTMDESSFLDGEVGKRLNQMVPVPHVPKMNGEIPSADEEISDHERLNERLKLCDLVENKVQGDGNCQFRALSDQLYRSPDHHKFVREQVVSQLKSNPQMYEGYVPLAYGDYLKKMSKNSEWGDHVTLQAAADSYGVKISVITSFKDTWYIEILPRVPKSKRVIWLSFWAEVHYNSIYPEGELPILEEKKKKKWWRR